MKRISRRNFIKYSAAGALALSTCSLPGRVFAGPDTDTILVTLMLDGGPDLRYLLTPPWDPNAGTYGNEFWTRRARTYEISPDNATELEAKWNEYHHLNSGGVSFGIEPGSAWLKDMFLANKVAVICNTFGSTNRNHAHSTITLERGDMAASGNDASKSGWGGRLVNACETNSCSLTSSIRQVCFGPHPVNPLDHDNTNVVDGSDTRQMGLFEYETDLGNNNWRWATQGIMSRALSSYYTAKNQEMASDSIYRPLLQSEQSVRSFGRLVNTRLDSFPIPSALESLYTNGSANELDSAYFGRQMRNIYDTLACEDLLNTNVISTEYTGWDNHRHMHENIRPSLNDIFGTGKGLETLVSSLNSSQPGKAPRIVFMVYGEFGRQLSANGDYGTDHGTGNYCMLIGDRVNGGLYGEMFPAIEVPKFSQAGTDIEGRTSFLQIIGRVCEQIKTGSGETTVPGWQTSAIESGVNLSGLFT